MARQFITFESGRQAFGIEVEHVREIRGWTAATPLPGTGRHVIGVLNLRGRVIPMLDLALLLGKPATSQEKVSVVMIVGWADKLFGLLVDRVEDILTFDEQDIQPAPDDAAHCLAGMLSVRDQLVPLLAVDALLAGETAALNAA